MRINVDVLGDIVADMRREVEAGERAVQRSIRTAGKGLQRDWRAQIEGAGLGSRLARTVRVEIYPKDQNSMNAAGLVWTRAPQIVDAFDKGALIRSKRGFYLAIPTAAAGSRGIGNTRITPESWEQRTGIKLRFVYRRRASLLVADDARLNTRSLATRNRRKVRKDGTRSGSMTIPIFILVPQVRIQKRLDLVRDANAWVGRLPQMITGNWTE